MKYGITLVAAIALGISALSAQPGGNQQQEVQVAPATGNQIQIATPQPQQPKLPAYMEEAKAMEPTTVEWYEYEHDFGKIIEGEVVKYTFHFKNTGDQPLKLLRVKPSCGCTTPSFTEGDIAPGEEGFIEVAFNSAHKRGFQSKAVTVTGNFEGTNMILRFKGEVVAPETEADPEG